MKRESSRRALLGLSLLVSLAGCARQQAAASHASVARESVKDGPHFPSIEADVNSGVTNPAFVPAPEDLTRLLERIEKLPGGGSEAGLWNGSGYRGFYVLINPQKVIRVYRDTIEIRTWTTEPKGSTAAYKRDETGAIEDELAKLLKKSGLAYGTHVDRDIESREDKRVLQQRVKR